MKTFKSRKLVTATPMTRGEYNMYRERDTPKDENPNYEGYLVEYLDGSEPNHPKHKGYISWLPKGQFDNGYSEITSGEYGINHSEGCIDIIFGDGKTGVQSLGFDGGVAGIVICRDGKHSKPFGINEDKDTYLSDEEKVIIRSTNPKSLQVIIDRLIEAKEFMEQ